MSREDWADFDDMYNSNMGGFRDPGGESALRKGKLKHECPTCLEPNMLSDADKARGYQCDGCANKQERGW